jgi:hypothetical protein
MAPQFCVLHSAGLLVHLYQATHQVVYVCWLGLVPARETQVARGALEPDVMPRDGGRVAVTRAATPPQLPQQVNNLHKQNSGDDQCDSRRLST